VYFPSRSIGGLADATPPALLPVLRRDGRLPGTVSRFDCTEAVADEGGGEAAAQDGNFDDALTRRGPVQSSAGAAGAERGAAAEGGGGEPVRVGLER
jgi:hypothetical protein